MLHDKYLEHDWVTDFGPQPHIPPSAIQNFSQPCRSYLHVCILCTLLSLSYPQGFHSYLFLCNREPHLSWVGCSFVLPITCNLCHNLSHSIHFTVSFKWLQVTWWQRPYFPYKMQSAWPNILGVSNEFYREVRGLLSKTQPHILAIDLHRLVSSPHSGLCLLRGVTCQIT